MPVSIPIRDEFDHPTGQFPYYDSLDATQLVRLRQQKHVNIRSFVQDDVTLSANMLQLTGKDMTTLSALDMAELQAAFIFERGEQWSTGTVGLQSDRQNFRGISVPLTNGATTTITSVIQPPDEIYLNATNEIKTVDLSSFADTDRITLSLPLFPAGSLDLAQSNIKFTSDPAGSFASETATIAFNDAAATLTPGTTANNEFRFPISLLAGIDKSKITGVQFNIFANAAGLTFRCIGFRAITLGWRLPTVDIDTVTKRLERAPSLNGAANPAVAFPTSALDPSDFPILWRADDPPASSDPRPIDSKLGVTFYSGSMTSASNDNIIRLFFREGALDYLTQLDLDPSSSEATSQLELNAMGKQPDFGRALYAPRTQTTIGGLTQEVLDEEDQSDLERIEDYVSASWIEVDIRWRNGTQSLEIKDTESNGWTWNDAGIEAQKYYIIFVDLIENSMQVRIYEMDSLGTIDWTTKVFDSTKIINSFVFKRRRGRIGYYAKFNDGDAALIDYKTRGFVFAEHRTKPFESVTTVEGARLYAAATPPRELFTGISSGPYGGQVTREPTISEPDAPSTDHAYKVFNPGNDRAQGIQTNEFYISDFNETEISFDLLFPQNAIDSGALLEGVLIGEYGRIVPLVLGAITGGRWQHIHLYLSSITTEQTGTYRLFLFQGGMGVETIWYIDNLSVVENVVAWSGRSNIPIPWEDNEEDWMPFRDKHSDLTSGVLFRERGRFPQVKGVALQQDAQISEVKIQPKYAQLGRLIWKDDPVPSNTDPVASFSPTVLGDTVIFDASASDDPDGYVVGYHWNFGDNSGDSGAKVSHTYDTPGTYTVHLVIIGARGDRNSTTGTVTIT